VLNRLVALYALRGNLDAAKDALERMRHWKGTLNFEGRKLHEATEGVVVLAEGRPAEAFDLLSATIADALRVEGPTSEGIRMGWPAAIDAAVQAGRFDEGAKLSALLEAEPPGPVGPYLRAQLRRGRGLLAAARGEEDGVEGDLRGAVDGFRALGYPYWLARAQTDLAGWLVEGGRPAEATPLLDDAVRVFQSLGAAPALARARELGSSPTAPSVRREALGA
jgi:hypothetical protein